MVARLVLVACLTVAPWPAGAQPDLRPIGARIRITPSKAYQPPSEQILTIPKPRRQISGQVIDVDSVIVTLRPDGSSDLIHVPIAALARVEVSRGRGSLGAAIGLGTAVGVGGFFAGGIAAASMCKDFLKCNGGVLVGGFATGLVLGSLVGAKIGGERWERSSIIWLQQPSTAQP